ncbi:MAG: lipoyl synthase [Desulfarculaceae bacterium]|nr:lipoyl synthase [Desulfarculaceae bacterium]MCF8049534.1 lipoyl synthase [Desulfarculaceae bacterium]
MDQNTSSIPKPLWLRRRLPLDGAVKMVEQGLRARALHTICEEGCCPNRGECFSRGVATMLIMGRVCTRDCRFCAVVTGRPEPLNPAEPNLVAGQVEDLGLKFVVITSVTRDDLPDGGAGHFAATVRALVRNCPGVGVEILVPDFKGSPRSLETVLAADPQVLAHNIETVPRLYPEVRPQAVYRRSLALLERAASHGSGAVKSGLMLGLGEEEQEVEAVMLDLLRSGCTIITLGQYLAPSAQHHPVVEYVPPQRFKELETIALVMGFKAVASGPFVRSSYLAEKYYALSHS